jgi:TetR/AcrR family transcriptional regulator, transcriptional repressor for nem operon
MNTREKLIETTRELLWERGYIGTSPKTIQERSGVGQGSMYHHFKGKSDLALESIKINGFHMKSISKERLSQGSTALEKIKTFLLSPRNTQLGCRIGGLTQDHYIVADKEMRNVLQESFEFLHNALAEVIREGQINGDFDKNLDADNIASAISAVLQGAYVLARAYASDKPFNSAIEGLISLLVKK